MKALILTLALALPAFASAGDLCGEVEIAGGNFSCDVDYCSIKFIATNLGTGVTDQYGIDDGGQSISRDYQIEQYQLEQLTGKRLCVSPSDVSWAGSIDVNVLRAAAATVIN